MYKTGQKKEEKTRSKDSLAKATRYLLANPNDDYLDTLSYLLHAKNKLKMKSKTVF